jgi:drug/metabolite transporter (DMT)-like permease
MVTMSQKSSLPQVAIFVSQVLIPDTAAQIALVQSLTPLLTAIFGMVLLRERLRTGQWLGLALGVAGVALVVGEAALESSARFQGLLLAFVGVLGLVT